MMKFTRGETFTTVLLAASGVVTGNETVVAVMKKARPDGSAPAPTAPVIAVFDATFVAEILPQRKPGWHLTIPATLSATISPGDYVSDARVTMADGVVEYSPINPITVEQGVS